jgi:ribonuclease HII
MPLVIGVDEVGVGALCGPVAAAAVVWPSDGVREGLGDSKKLSPKRRAQAAQWLRKEAPFWTVGFASAKQVDLHGVHACRFWLMEVLAQRCREVAGELRVLVDGNQVLNVHGCEAIPKGDDLVPAISAASILAKTYRDQYMILLASDHPEYGFDKHKGYSTKDHRARLREHGLCEEHRRSFTLG